jgi:UDP-N-acetylmuramoyl-tripeptide--D-alanyl-D-alanine ligase
MAGPVGSLPEGVTGISIDSRTVGEGDAFFAIKGDKFDGHDFASAAIANGAALLVVAEAKLPALGRLTAPMIVVNDVLSALEDLGRAARARSEAQIIAITGSVGKTSSKEMLRRALEPSGRSPCLGGLLQQSLGRAADAGADAGRAPNTASSKSA